MARNPLIRRKERSYSTPMKNQSAGILDDHAVRKAVMTKEAYADSLSFNINYTQTGDETEGTLFWDDTDKTLSLVGNDTTLQVGQELYVRVRNPPAGSTITDGKVVYISAQTGVFPDIALAKSDSATTSNVLGVVTEDIESPDFGFVTTYGYVRGVKTNYSKAGDWGTAWTSGDKLYVSKTVAGQLTNVEPAAPHHSDVVATVGVIGAAGVGSILVNNTKHYTMEELTDVDGTPLTTTGQFPVWDNTNGYFDFNYNIANYVPYTGATTNVNLGTYTLTTTGDITAGSLNLTETSIDYYFGKDAANWLSLAPKTGSMNIFRMYPPDDDATAASVIQLHTNSTTASRTNNERVSLQIDHTDGVLLQVAKSGTGAVLPLVIETSGNTDQVKLNTDGSITFNGDMVGTEDLYFTGSGSGLPFAEIYVYDNSTADTVSSGSYVQMTRFDTNGESNLCTPDHTNDHITITKAGRYKIDFSASFSGAASVDWKGGVFKNNGVTQLTNIQVERKLGAGGDIGVVAASGIANLAANDTIELWLRQDEGVDKTITVVNCNLNVMQVGG